MEPGTLFYDKLLRLTISSYTKWTVCSEDIGRQLMISDLVIFWHKWFQFFTIFLWSVRNWTTHLPCCWLESKHLICLFTSSITHGHWPHMLLAKLAWQYLSSLRGSILKKICCDFCNRRSFFLSCVVLISCRSMIYFDIWIASAPPFQLRKIGTSQK